MAEQVLFGDWAKALGALRGLRQSIPRALKTALLQEAQFARTAIIEGIDSQAPGGERFAPLAQNTLMIRRIQAAGKAMATGARRTEKIYATASAKGGGWASTALSKANSVARDTSWKAIGAGMRAVDNAKILVQTGTLRASISVVRRGDAVFVGVQRSAQSRDGKSLYNLARIHEFGMGPVAIRWTAKSRAFWFAMIARAGLSSHGSKGGGGMGGMRLVRIPARPYLRPVFRALYGNRLEAGARYVRRVIALLASHLKAA